MNINKKFDRVKQWAGEKMGAECKTIVSDEFKNLEQEMALRQEGLSLPSVVTICLLLTPLPRHGKAA
jgi:hypothetical protein